VQKREWRIVYHVGSLTIAVLDVFAKSTRGTPDNVIGNCRRRLADFKALDER